MKNFLLGLGCAALLVVGCSSGDNGSAQDAGNGSDVQVADNGAVDSGRGDGAVDASAVDSGAVDSGAVDAGAGDSGAVDAGRVDSGPSADVVVADVVAVDGNVADVPPAVDAAPGDVGACMPITSDGSSVGLDCRGDAGVCPSGYSCAVMSGIVAQYHCEIRCARSCDCPNGFQCEEVRDKNPEPQYFCRAVRNPR